MNTGDSEVSFIVMNPSGGKKEKELLDGKAKKKEDAASPALAPMASAMGAAAMMGKEPLTKPKEGHTKPKEAKGFKFSIQQSRLEPGGRQRITFWCVPEAPGRQTQSLIIRDITHAADNLVAVSFTARKVEKEWSSYVRFPDGDSALDFGDCYIAPSETTHHHRFLKTAAMRIQSVHRQPLLLTIRSNLANQILIFSDEKSPPVPPSFPHTNRTRLDPPPPYKPDAPRSPAP